MFAYFQHLFIKGHLQTLSNTVEKNIHSYIPVSAPYHPDGTQNELYIL